MLGLRATQENSRPARNAQRRLAITHQLLQRLHILGFQHQRLWLSTTHRPCLRKDGPNAITSLGDGQQFVAEFRLQVTSVFLTASRQLLAQAASAQELADFDLHELTELLHTASRGRFDRAKAEALQTVAKQSVGVRFLADAAQLQVRCLLAQMDLLEEQRQRVDDALAQLMDQVPQHLTSLPGVGPTTGAALLAEIGDIQRFDAPEKLVAYAGIDATVYQTGQFEARQMHMSKRGSPYLRHALWQAASMAIMHDDELRAYYDRKRKEGKAHGTALGAVCRKLITRVYIVLKENRPYEVRTKH
jgi:transposase